MDSITQHIGVAIKPMTNFYAAQTAGAESAITGAAFDRTKYGSMQLQLVGETALTDTKNLSVTTLRIEHSDESGSGFTTYSSIVTAGVNLSTGLAEVLKLADSSTDFTFEGAYNVNLAAAKKYIRVYALVDMDAGATDTVNLVGSFTLGGTTSTGVALTKNYFTKDVS